MHIDPRQIDEMDAQDVEDLIAMSEFVGGH